jgi:hypothetical protein
MVYIYSKTLSGILLLNMEVMKYKVYYKVN